MREPILSLALGEITGVLALVIRTEGPSYRSVGASMVFCEDGGRVGSLSSGCIEADLAIHADQVRSSKAPKRVLYGKGSPFLDIVLPCGGGLEILLLPYLTDTECSLVTGISQRRQPAAISISLLTGRLSPSQATEMSLSEHAFHLFMMPALRFAVFGKGPEASTFANLLDTLGYEGVLLSPDLETLEIEGNLCWQPRQITHPHCPLDLPLDARTAVVLFFHDHDWEAPILRDIAEKDVFYIGCQGSKRTSEARMHQLSELGVTAIERQKIRGPIGLIPSVRNSKTLAVSVLAEILSLN